MLFRQEILAGIAEGRVTLAFRRWRKAPPADGSTLRTPVGVIALDRVREIDEPDITDDDVGRCGAASREILLRSLGGEGRLLRIELRLVGDDPRIALREQPPDEAELALIVARLDRLDAAADAPWTLRVLRLIADRPGTLARTLAEHVGAERMPFKRRVRQLKELGLTESLEVGYRLSPRGRHLLAHVSARPR